MQDMEWKMFMRFYNSPVNLQQQNRFCINLRIYQLSVFENWRYNKPGNDSVRAVIENLFNDD